MKFLLITHIYPPAVDGGSKVIAKMGEYLAKDVHQVHVLTSDCHSTDDFVTPISDNLKVRQSDSPNISRLPVYHRLRQPLKALRLFLGLFFGCDSYLVQLFEIFEKGPIFRIFPTIYHLRSIILFRPDYIIAGPLPTTIVLYARFVSLLTHSKLIINASFHATDPAFSKKPLINTLRTADYLWTLTDHETHHFHKKFHIPHSKLLQLGNGVDPKFLEIRNLDLEISPSLLYVGSFAAHKNIPVLIRAFDILAPQFPDLTLTLAGQKTLFFPEIQKLLNMLPDNIRSRINIIFDFPNKKLAKLYDRASILVQPSTQESFGLTLIEAWARRLPVIASDIPAFEELIIKSNGGLNFEVSNAHDLAAKIQTLLLDTHLRQKLAENGYNYVTQHFLWDKIAHSLCQKLST